MRYKQIFHISKILALLLVVWPLSDGSTETAKQPNEYKFSLSAIRCLIRNATQIRSLASSIIILDVSSCPPRGLEAESLVSVQDSAVPLGDMGLPNNGARTDSILIIPKNKVSCFMSVIEGLSDATTEPISVDFSHC